MHKKFFGQIELDENFLQVACKLMMASEMEMPCCVRGYHVYKEVWEAAIGEVMECHREPTNASFHVLDCSKNFHCIIILMQKIFVRFQQTKIFLRRKKANYGRSQEEGSN